VLERYDQLGQVPLAICLCCNHTVAGNRRFPAPAWATDDVALARAARDRRAGGPTAPREGLYLVEVRYPEGAQASRPPAGQRPAV
jgi:hypothetical protein